MELSNTDLTEYIEKTKESGVKPLELVFYPITDIDEGYPIAYRTATTVNSVILGTMTQDFYKRVSDKRDCGLQLLKHNIQHVINAFGVFDKAGRDVKFITLRCPSEFAKRTDVYDSVKEVLKNNADFKAKRLCFEIPSEIMKEDEEKARQLILDLKLLKVSTAITNCGKSDFPLSRLADLSPDYVFVDPSQTAYAGSRNKPMLLSSLISYLTSMGSKVICEGNAEARQYLRNADAIGFCEHNAVALSLKDAVNQKENDDA